MYKSRLVHLKPLSIYEIISNSLYRSINSVFVCLNMTEFHLLMIAITVTTMSATFIGALKVCPLVDPVNRTIVVSHESDCTKFYKCFMGVKYEMTCPEYREGQRLCFNPETENCDWPSHVACCNGKSPDPRCPPLSDYATTVWPHPTDCSLYYVCKDGRKYLQWCQRGQLFDPDSLVCKPRNNVVCTEHIACPPVGASEIVYLPHECNCMKYYECINGESVRKHCPADKMFDHVRRKCVPAEEAVCHTPPPNNCPLYGIKNIPHENSCSLYYMCKNGVQELQQCGSGLYFDKVKSMCTWWENAKCDASSSLESPWGTLPNVRSRTELQNRMVETMNSLIECPPAGSGSNTTLPHECSCVKYYLCLDGSMIVKRCPEGTEYDYIRRVCDDPDIVKCKRPIPDLTTSTVSPSTPTTTETPTTIRSSTILPVTSTTKQTDAISTTPAWTTGESTCPPTGRVNIPHEINCADYYECDNGHKLLRHCLQGYYFNALLGVCDFPEVTNCGNRSTPTTVTTPSTPSIVTTPSTPSTVTTPSTPSTVTTPSTPSTVTTPSTPSTVTTPSTPSTVTTPSTPSTVTTPSTPSTVTTPSTPSTVTTPSTPSTVTTPSTPSTVTTPSTPSTPSTVPTSSSPDPSCPAHDSNCVIRLPHPDDCSWYYECEDGIKVKKECHEGLQYNKELKMCDLPQYVTCDCDSCIPERCTGQTIHHECQCHLYYICSHGESIRKECSDGDNYDYKKKKCLPKDEAVCYHNQNANTMLLGCSGSCPNSYSQQKTVFLPHKDCTKFCQCENGTSRVSSCEEGFHFSRRNETCMHPAEARCDLSIAYNDKDRRSVREVSFWDNIPGIRNFF